VSRKDRHEPGFAVGVLQGADLAAARPPAIGAVTRVCRVGDVRLAGGGGTDLRVGMEAAESAHPLPDVVVALTDGCTPWPDRPTRARLVIAVIGDRVAAQHVPEWDNLPVNVIGLFADGARATGYA